MPFRRSFRCKLCDDFSFFYILKFIFVNVHGFSYQLSSYLQFYLSRLSLSADIIFQCRPIDDIEI